MGRMKYYKYLIKENWKHYLKIVIQFSFSFFIIFTLRIIIHEMGHVIVALLNGCNIIHLGIDLFSGSILITYDVLSSEQYIMISLGAVIMVCLVFIPLIIMTHTIRLRILTFCLIISLTMEIGYLTYWDMTGSDIYKVFYLINNNIAIDNLKKIIMFTWICLILITLLYPVTTIIIEEHS